MTRLEALKELADDRATKPTLWRDMTPEEKGALLLAHHEGKVIEGLYSTGWEEAESPVWWEDKAYRIRPEPVRETVTLHYGLAEDATRYQSQWDTHRITFDLVEGKPDLTSIRMEQL